MHEDSNFSIFNSQIRRKIYYSKWNFNISLYLIPIENYEQHPFLDFQTLSRTKSFCSSVWAVFVARIYRISSVCRWWVEELSFHGIILARIKLSPKLFSRFSRISRKLAIRMSRTKSNRWITVHRRKKRDIVALRGSNTRLVLNNILQLVSFFFAFFFYYYLLCVYIYIF